MKKILIMILVTSLILLNCSSDSTDPADTYYDSPSWTAGLASADWFPGIDVDDSGAVFVSIEPFNIKDISSGATVATTYAFIKILGLGKIVAGLYADKNTANPDGYVSKTRDETITYAKNLTTKLDDFTVVDNFTTYKRTFSINKSEYKVEDTNTFNSERVYSYKCRFDITEESSKGSIVSTSAIMEIHANIVDNNKLKVYALKAPGYHDEYFYIGEYKSINEADKLLYTEYSKMKVYFFDYPNAKIFKREN